MKKNIVIDLVNNKTTADSLMLYDAVRLEVITGTKGLFSVRDEKIPKLIIAWHRFPLLEEPNNWMISEDGSSATLEFVLKSFGIKDSFVHIPAKGFRLFEFNIIIPKNNVAVASVRINVQNNTLEGIPFSQQDRDKLDSIDLANYYTKVEVDNKFASFDPGSGGEGAVYTFTKPLNVDANNVVSIDLTDYAKLTDLPIIPKNLSSFTNDTGFITNSALNGYATELFVTSRGYITAADITIPTNISSFFNDAGYITINDVPSVDLTPYALKSELFSKKFADITDTPTTLEGYGITDAYISGRTITLGGNSIAIPESSGGSGDYTLTKAAVDGVIGASATGSTAKFYNEQGAFTEVDMSAYATSDSVALSISTHNTDATAHTNLFALKVDTDTYNTAITAINTALNGKENTGVAQGLVDAHNESATAHEALFEAKADKTALENYLPLSGGTMTGGVLFDSESAVSGSTTAGSITVNGGQGWGFGGSVAVYGSTHETRAGRVIIRAYDGTNEKRLEVCPDGTFNFDGQSVLNPIGTVIAFAGNSAPTGYLICNGAAVNRTTYAKLFDVIGTLYGEGDGSTTFNLPNLTNKFIMGSGTAGTSKAAGLPNISGSFDLRKGATNASTNLAFTFKGSLYTSSSSTTSPTVAYAVTSVDAYTPQTINIDASKSSSIYKDDVTTVQPPALTMRFYIKY